MFNLKQVNTVMIKKWELLLLHAFIFVLPAFCTYLTSHAVTEGLITTSVASFVTSAVSYIFISRKTLSQ